MAVRGDISVLWSVSPRIIEVAAPSTEVTVQDLVDTLRTLESELGALDDDYLIDAAGKEELGGGVYVAVTLQLQNAQVRFQARPGPSWVACKISGGNLVGVDLLGDPMDPIAPSAYVTVTYAQAVSAALLDAGESDDPWVKTLPGSYPAGSAGYIVGSNLDAKSSDIQNQVAFDGYVWIDTVIGVSGTTYPTGTQRQPSNNFDDALAIAQANGITKFKVTGMLSIGGSADANIEGYVFEGFGYLASEVFFSDAHTVDADYALFSHMAVGGFAGGSWFTCVDCQLGSPGYWNLYDPDGYFVNCYVACLTNVRGAHFINCSAWADPHPAAGSATVGFYTGARVMAVGCQGSWKITAFTAGMFGGYARFNFGDGKLIVSSGCASGSIEVEGNCAVDDQHTGTCVVIDNTLSGMHGPGSWEDSGTPPTPEAIAQAVVDKDPGGGETVGDLLERLPELTTLVRTLKKYKANRLLVANNQLTVYDDDGATPILVQDLFDASGNPSMKIVYERVPVP